jgi:hypothetical protein
MFWFVFNRDVTDMACRIGKTFQLIFNCFWRPGTAGRDITEKFVLKTVSNVIVALTRRRFDCIHRRRQHARNARNARTRRREAPCESAGPVTIFMPR